MNVRRAQRSDLPALQILLQALCEEERRYAANQPIDFSFSPEGEEFLLQRITGDATFAWISEETTGIQGFTVGSLDARDPEWARIESAFILPSARGQGHAKKLLSQFISWAQLNGASEITVGVASANSHAIAFYGAAGFREVERLGCTAIFKLSLADLVATIKAA